MADERVIAGRIAAIRARVRRAAEAAGRDPGTIRLIGVTKTVGLGEIEAAAAAGVTEFGESRVQDAAAKMAHAGHGRPWTWHFIGRLQRNKVRAAVGRFSLIHSVDTLRLGEAVESAAAAAGIRQRVLVQVNIGREAQKGGAAPSELRSLLAGLATLPHVDVIGVMAVPPADDDPEQSRPYFRELRQLGAALGEEVAGVRLSEYSMGMSHDFEVAIAEGSTMIRIGTALFGLRAGAATEAAGKGVPLCS